MRETTVVHFKSDKCDVYIGRPSPWGNPWTHRGGTSAEFCVESRSQAIENYRKWLLGLDFLGILCDKRAWIRENLPTLKGKMIGCWCSPKPCHGDVLADLCNEKPVEMDLF